MPSRLVDTLSQARHDPRPGARCALACQPLLQQGRPAPGTGDLGAGRCRGSVPMRTSKDARSRSPRQSGTARTVCPRLAVASRGADTGLRGWQYGESPPAGRQNRRGDDGRCRRRPPRGRAGRRPDHLRLPNDLVVGTIREPDIVRWPRPSATAASARSLPALTRDVNALRKIGLIRRVQGGIVANSDVIRAFLPERRALGNDESAPPSGRT
jgi:hypothetical protein